MIVVRLASWDCLWCIGWYVGLKRAYKSWTLDTDRVTRWRDSRGKSWRPMVGRVNCTPLPS
nr:MAG TPA: hypothetical protein [Caudoviricetes sp.]